MPLCCEEVSIPVWCKRWGKECCQSQSEVSPGAPAIWSALKNKIRKLLSRIFNAFMMTKGWLSFTLQLDVAIIRLGNGKKWSWILFHHPQLIGGLDYHQDQHAGIVIGHRLASFGLTVRKITTNQVNSRCNRSRQEWAEGKDNYTPVHLLCGAGAAWPDRTGCSPGWKREPLRYGQFVWKSSGKVREACRELLNCLLHRVLRHLLLQRPRGS